MKANPTILKLMCVTLVVSIVFPLGRALYPYVANKIGPMPFDAIEAVMSATIGFGIYEWFFF